MHRQFFKIVIIFKLIAMIEEIHFILHVANGIHIIIHNVKWYNYTNSNKNNSIFIRIHVRIRFC